MIELVLFVFGFTTLGLGILGYKLSKSAKKAKMKQDIQLYKELKENGEI